MSSRSKAVRAPVAVARALERSGDWVSELLLVAAVFAAVGAAMAALTGATL